MALNAYSIMCTMSTGLHELSLSHSRLRVTEEGGSMQSKVYTRDALVLVSQRCLYVVSQSWMHVVLPPMEMCHGKVNVSSKWACLLPLESLKPAPRQWELEVLDMCLVFSSVKEVEQLCMENDGAFS